LRDVKTRQQSAHGRQQQQHQQHPHNSLKKNKEKKAGTLSRELPWKKKRDRNLSSNKGIDFQDDDDGPEESDQVPAVGYLFQLGCANSGFKNIIVIIS
jgi:hypothetical protein